jgi:hypothetical protein
MINQLRFAYFTDDDGAVDIELAPNTQFALIEVRVHLDGAGGAGDLTVAVDSEQGAEYDTVLKTQDMTAVTDLMYQPDHPFYLDVGDKIKVEWANAGDKAYGITLIYEVF